MTLCYFATSLGGHSMALEVPKEQQEEYGGRYAFYSVRTLAEAKPLHYKKFNITSRIKWEKIC